MIVSMNTAQTQQTEQVARAASLEAIAQVVATVERTQRAKDAEGFLALFHPEALWTPATARSSSASRR